MKAYFQQKHRALTLIVLGLGFLSGCTAVQPDLQIAPLEQQIVDLRDLFQAGEKRFQAALSADSVLAATHHSRRQVVVLILIDIRWDDGELEQAQQSGLILETGSMVLTAGHGFIVEGGEILNIRARTSDRREYRLELLEVAYETVSARRVDHAILRASHSIEGQALTRPENRPHRDRILILGYPGALGVNDDGEVTHTMESRQSVVYPLGLLCRQKFASATTLYPISGAIPVQGISGAPVFTAKGHLMGIFSSLNRRRDVSGWYYTFGLSPIPWERLGELQENADP